MRSLITLSLVLFIGMAAAQTTVPNNTIISSNTTWTAAGSPYTIQGLVTVNATRTLTIEAGASVNFDTGARIIVNGTVSGPTPGAALNSSSTFPDNWYIQVNSSGIVNLTSATINSADYMQVNAGGSMTLTTCTVDNPYFTSNGTLNLVGGTYTCYRPLDILTVNAGTTTLNGAGLDGGGTATVGVLGVSGNLALQNATITGCEYPIKLTGTTSITASGIQTLSGNIYDVVQTVVATVGNNWNLAALPIPYELSGGITVNAGAVWTIALNSIIHVPDLAIISLDGTLNASSTTFDSNTGGPVDWSLTVNSGGNANLNACTVHNGEQMTILTGGAATLTNCTIDHPYIVSSGSLNVTVGTFTLSRPGTLIAVITGTTVLNGVQLIGTTSGTTGINAAGGALTLQSLSITGMDLPVLISAPGAISSSGVHTITGNLNQTAQLGFSTIAADLTLPSLPIPYYAPGGLLIQSGATLTIASNNVIKVGLYQEILVNGRMNAVATAGQKIYFTSYREDNRGGDSNGDGGDTAPAIGDWGGIRFQTGANPASSMTRCETRYASGYQYYGGVSVVACAPAMNNCEFYQNQFGIALFDGATPTINACTMGSSTVTPIAMTMDADPTFTSNVFSFQDNTYDAIGLIGSTLAANGNIIQRSVTGITNVTYVLLSTITVPVGRSLNIAAGVVIKSFPGVRMNVEGILNMNGTSGQNVIFTSVADDSAGNPGDTNKDGNITQPDNQCPNFCYCGSYQSEGIVIAGGANVNLTYAKVRYQNGQQGSFYTGYSPVWGYAILDCGGTVQLNNCVFSDQAYGYLGMDASTAAITNCQFNNLSYAPIAIRPAGNPTFSGITFNNVGITALGLIGGDVTVNGLIRKRNLAGYTNITQVLITDLTIASGTNVEVQAGVVLKMGYYFNSCYGYNNGRIIVNGGFKISGTVAEPVVITSWRDDNYGVPADTDQDGGANAPTYSDWYGIYFEATANDAYNTITYANLRNGGSYWCCSTDEHRGLVNYTNAGGTITNSTFFNGTYGVCFIGASNPSISTSSFDYMNSEPFGTYFESTPILSTITLGSNNTNNGIRLLPTIQAFDATLQQGFINGFGPIAYISSGLTIGTNATLTIAPGTIIKLDGGIAINGGLVAVGTVPNPIYFTSLADDSQGGDTNNNGNATVPGSGDWSGIGFNQGSLSGSNHLRYCNLRYGGGTSQIIRFSSTGGLVEDCAFEFAAGYGFGVYGSANPTFQNNFLNLIGQAPVYMSAFANPTFTNNSINNVGIMAIALVPENIGADGTIPLRALAGYNPIAYYLPGQMNVLNGVTLTIPAGAVFKRPNDYGLAFNIDGKLIVQGNSGVPVVFTDLTDDSVGLPGDMNQDGASTTPSVGNRIPIRFNAISDDASLVQYAQFRYASAGVSTVSAQPTIQNCTFSNCNYGINSSGTEGPHIPNNTFVDLTQTPVLTGILCIPDQMTGETLTGTTKKMLGIAAETLLQNKTLSKIDFGSITNIPYYFPNGYSVGTNAALTVAPGVVCKFASAGLSVSRTLNAIGSAAPTNTIVFTHEADDLYGGDSNSDGVSTPGAWAGITFENASVDNTCLMDYCVVRHASNGVTCQSASPTITHTRFQNLTHGVVANVASQPVLTNNDFQDITGFGVRNVSLSFLINATNCWWGNNSGPTHSGNPGGTGVSVTNQVNYLPFQNTGAQMPLMGDVSLNGVVQAFDASQVLQYTASLITLNALQLQVGDVTGNGGVSALDAAHILQHVVGLRPTFDAELNVVGGGGTQQMQQLLPVDLVVSDASATAGETFTVDIDLSGVNELYSLQTTLNYDAQYLTLTSVESLLPGTFSWANSEPTPGTVLFSAASAFAMTTDGPALRLTFTASTGFATDLITYVEPTTVSVDETDMTPYATHGIVTLAPGLTTGTLEELVAATGLVIYPNPAVDGFTVTWGALDKSAAVELGIFDTTGRLVFATRLSPNASVGGSTVHVDRSALTGADNLSGPLFVRVAQGNEVVWGRVVLN